MLNNSLRVLFYSSICVFFLFSACGDSTSVGGDIFSNEDLEVLFADDIELIAQTVRLDSIKTYDNSEQTDNCLTGTLPVRKWNGLVFPTHHLGEIDDPIFGKSKSSIYTEVGFEISNATFVIPNYSGTMDSMVLNLVYDTSAFYGDINETFDVEVYRVLESFDAVGDVAYNSTNLEISTAPIAKREDIQYSLDSLNILIPGLDSANLRPAALRIVFDSLLMDGMPGLPVEIFNDAIANSTNDQFQEVLKGLYITTTPGSNVMAGILFNNSYLEMYYTEDDGDKGFYQYRLFWQNLISFNNIESDRDGKEAALAAEGISTENILYVSGQDGFDVMIDFSDVDKFQDIAINKAELEFTAVQPVGQEDPLFPYSERLILSQLGDNNELICINDVSISLSQANGGSIFGGESEEVEENGTVLRKYSMNITAHLQNYMEGSTSPIIVLSVDNRTDDASRTMLFGPEHPTHPAKLKLTYTAP